MPEFAPVLVLDQIDGSNGYLIAGAQFNSKFGEWVASAGDINGDGFEDIIISADEYDFGATTKAGAVYVLFGGAANLAALDAADAVVDGIIQTSLLDGYNGFQVHGSTLNQQFGQSVNGAGDIDGDGFDDLIIGVDNTTGGQAYLLFGKAAGFAASGTPVLNAGTDGYIFSPAGPNGGDDLGYSVSSAGDFNGDGFDDFLIGARFADPLSGATDDSEGAAYLVFGGRSNLQQLDGDDGAQGGSINLAHLSTGEGSVLTTIGTSEQGGLSVSSLGDINGDGYDDIGMTAPLDDPNSGSTNGNEGRAVVVFGRPDSTGISASVVASSLNGAQGFSMAGLNNGDRLGREISGGGDVNGDGFGDFIVSAPYADPYGQNSTGTGYVVFGKSLFRRTEDLSGLDGTNGFRVHGARSGDYTGISASILGDINGDGFDDVAIGAHFFDTLAGTNVGALYVVFGKAGGFAADIDLTRLDGDDGFRIEGTPEFRTIARNLGKQLGDINGDGFDDILVGAYGGFTDGEAFIIFGHKAQSSVVRVGTHLSQTQNGGIGDDEIFGNDGNDILIGHEGFDYLDSGAGNDILNGGAGADEMRGGSGRNGASYEDAGGAVYADLINSGDNSGEAAGDTYAWVQDLHGSAFNDTLLGDGRVNFLFGNGGNDTLNGRAGDDFLEGGAGADALVGGGGINTAAYSLAGGPVVADLVLPFRNQGDALGDSYSQMQNMAGSVFADELWGSFGVNRIDGGDGDDFLRGRNGNDILNGGMGDDTLEGGANADQLNGGGGVDTAAYQLSSIGVTADLIVTANNTGDAAGDTYSQIQNLTGSIKADTLRGTFSANVLNGSGGNDVLQGRGGGDTYTGGADSDRFVFQNGFGLETITDFNEFNPLETIDLSVVTEIVSFADLQANHMFQAGAHVEIIDGLGGVITVLNAQVSDMDAGDFNF